MVMSIVGLSVGTTQAIDPWKVSVLPDVILIGDNITIQVRGVPNTYVFVDIYNAKNEMIHDMFIQTSDRGTYNSTWTVPMEEKGGIYRTEVVFEDTLVAQYEFEVVYDEDLYQDYKMDGQQEQINKLQDRVDQYAREVHELRMQNTWLEWGAKIAIGITVILLGWYIFTHKAVLDYYWGKLKDRKGPKEAYFSVFNPYTRGILQPWHSHIQENFNEVRSKKEKEYNLEDDEKVWLVKASPDAIYEVEEVELKDLSSLAIQVKPNMKESIKKLKKEGGKMKFSRKNGEEDEVPKTTDMGKVRKQQVEKKMISKKDTVSGVRGNMSDVLDAKDLRKDERKEDEVPKNRLKRLFSRKKARRHEE